MMRGHGFLELRVISVRVVMDISGVESYQCKSCEGQSVF